VGQGGVVHLWVVAVDLIHPALKDLEEEKEKSLNSPTLLDVVYMCPFFLCIVKF